MTALNAPSIGGVFAALVATAAGFHAEEDPEYAAAAYLLTLLGPDELKDPEKAADAARSAARLMLMDPPDASGVPDPPEDVDLAWSDGPLGQSGLAREQLHRVLYGANAVIRLARAEGDGTAAREKEARYYAQHREAAKAREGKMADLDRAHSKHGRIMGWYGIVDSATTPECRDAIGKNFDVLDPPSIGLPGLGPHNGCRCHAGPPHPEGTTMRGANAA